ncbi:MAG: nucleoside phosphorylase [Saprospiraceae bacterium]|nr:nucleoside phosphorylase [Saprospiraceae bacterium]
MKKIKESELIINPDNSIYHLKLKPEDIARDIIVVGDHQRVEVISNYFDKIEFKNFNREFVTHTGYLNNKRISVIGTGIGTDNMDIVLNELDAIANIDLENRVIKEKHTSLNIIRLGTSGAIQKEIPIDSIAMSSYGLGFDGLLNFYGDKNKVDEVNITEAFIKQTDWGLELPKPYVVKASEVLEKELGAGLIKGITATAPGFYGPQGRVLRLKLAYPELNEKIESFYFQNKRIINFEMETSALYGLGKMLGHNTLTICAIIANRVNQEYSKDYKKTVKKMIELVLERLTKNV